MATEQQKKTYREAKSQLRAQIIEDKIYYCEKCDTVYRDNANYEIHLISKKHTGNYISYECTSITVTGTDCNFKTHDKALYNRHLKTKKHNYGHDQ